MATVALHRRLGLPSPFAVDLAKARVDLAALRARQGLKFGEQALESAKLLKDYYSRQLQAAKSPDPIISDELAQDEKTRQALQNGLASISRTKPSFDDSNEQLVGQLLALLSTLAEPGDFGPEEGKKLHGLLHSLEPKPVARSSSPQFTKLSKSLDVSSKPNS